MDTDTQTPERFWLIWCPYGKNPTKKHDTLISAIEEAQRLAAKEPRNDFYVLQSTHYTIGNVKVEVVRL